jgi:transposase InsO family protein
MKQYPEPVVLEALESAQYTSADYGELARQNGVVLSIGRKGECWWPDPVR